jgi:DNA-binding XRE family transcriptional regulator
VSTENELFSAVDALLEQVPSDDLPPPPERRRLREAAGLSQTQIATALGTRREAVGSWEAGQREPRPPQRAAYARLLEGLAQRFPAAPADAATPPVPDPQPAAAAPQAVTGPAAPPAAADRTATSTRSTAPRPATAARSTSTSRRPGAKKASAKPAPAAPALAPSAVDPRFAHGPLGVLDGDGSLYCAGGLVLECPATSVPELVAWTLTEAKLGASRLHRSGKDSDPLIVVTSAAAERLGLPERLEDRRSMRLPEDHKVVKQIGRAKWQLTKRGFGPWARVYRPAQGQQRQCVQLAVLPWDALDSRAWGSADQLPPAELARVLTAYASRVLTPRGSTAVAGLELMSALRPPTRAVKDDTTGAWVSGPVPGSLTAPVAPAYVEAPDEGVGPEYEQNVPRPWRSAAVTRAEPVSWAASATRNRRLCACSGPSPRCPTDPQPHPPPPAPQRRKGVR